MLAAAAGAAEQPAITFSTYLGIADCDAVAAWHGDAFLACHSPGNRLAHVQGPEPLANVMGGYVLRLNVKTGKLIYATNIGGSDFTAALRIKVDRQGFAYAVGLTRARDFPTTPDALQRQFAGGDTDAFLVKVAPSGQVVYATLLGGSGADQGNSVELDRKGGVLVGGTTASDDFPGQPKVRAGRGNDAFVSYLRPAEGNSFRSVVFGGGKEEKLTGLAADGRGSAFAVGYTKSGDFPVVAPTQAQLRGISDAFLTRLRIPDLTLTSSTYFGGSGDDSGWGVAVDKEGNPLLAGITNSGDLPVSSDAFQRAAGGKLDAFLARFVGPAFATVRTTYFGGSGDDSSGYDGDDLKVDSAGNVWLVGLTGSRDLPLRRATQPVYAGGDTDGFLAVFSSQLTKLCFATYHGGSDRDLLEGLDLSGQDVIATGLTFSNDLPVAGRAVERKLSAVIVAGRTVNTMVLAVRVSQSCR
jgi:hypothetical protein